MNLDSLIATASSKYGVPADLIAGVVHRESGGDPLAVGDGGLALGLMQIHPGAAKDIGLDWNALRKAIEAGDAEKAAELGIEAVAYLALMLKETHGNQRLALCAYNQGPSVIRNQTSEAAKKGFAYADSILKTLPKPGAAMPSKPVNAAFNATASGGIAGAADTLVVWGLSLVNVTVPAKVEDAIMLLLMSGISYFIHTRTTKE